MKRRLLLFVGLVGLAASSAVQAQVTYKQPNADPLAIAVMSDFARCIADSDPVGAHRVLDTDYHSSGYNAFVRDFSIKHRQCLHGGQLRFNQILVIGGMAEELNRKAGLTLERLTALSASDTAPGAERCLIKKQPGAVWSLFSKAPASRAEAVAIDALQGDYADCLPADRTPVFSALALRSRLAIAVYHLMTTPTAEG